MEQAPAPVVAKKSGPGEFVRSVVGRPVVVRLASGVDYKGVLVCLDGFMNIALEQTEEYVDGALKAKLGDCFIRGNNGAWFGVASLWAGRCAPFPRVSLFTPSPPPLSLVHCLGVAAQAMSLARGVAYAPVVGGRCTSFSHVRSWHRMHATEKLP